MASIVAICIPTFNQAPYLAAAVRSACAQTHPVEVWVGDDCSTDETPAILSELQREFPALHVERQSQNQGITRNNNALLALPETEFVARLDSDDLLHPQYIEKLVSLLHQHPQAAYAHCAVQEIGERNEARRVRRLGGRREFQSADEALRAQAAGYRVAANICVFRAQALREACFYREEVRYSQDWDLAVRLADAGWSNVYLDEVLASYRVWEDSGQFRPRRRQIEVEDCLHIHDGSLRPAFERRGWDLKFLDQQRRSLALVHGSVLDSPLFSPAEKRQLLDALHQLGDSRRLRVQTALLSLGGGPLVRAQNRLEIVVKDFAKRLLHGARRSAPASQ